ncbi:MAG: Superfamily II DNA or RNA helicase [Verrucomicrobia bacterium]|nr:MAG: Superfamily II DNA or RNA helicase [Verrucomicrobiota bacterium]
MLWRSYFDEGALQRGKAYAVRERVSQLAIREAVEGWVIEGRVRGSRSTPYLSRVEVPCSGDDGNFGAVCTCPLGGDCKHAVALIETFLVEEKGGVTPVRTNREAPVESSLPTNLRHWIDVSLRGASGNRAAELPKEMARLVRYSFHLGESGRRGGVARLTLLAFATGGKGRQHGAAALLRGLRQGEYPAYLGEEDVRLVKEMELLSNTMLEGTFGASGMVPKGRFWSILISDVLATKRAIWDGEAEALLGSGPERELEPCWVADPRGRDGDLLSGIRFADSGKPAVIVGTKPELYIDPNSRTVGLAVWKESVDPLRWLEAPPVAAGQLGRVCERMAVVGWSPALRPSELEIRDLSAHEAALVPRLVLTRMPVKAAGPDSSSGIWMTAREARQVPVALFQVRYGSILVENPLADRGQFVTSVTSEAILRAKRDFSREERFVGLLSALGLAGLEEVFELGAGQRSGKQNVFTLPGERRGSGQGADEWYAFLGLLPKVQEMDWEIEIRSDFGMKLTYAEEWWTELEEEGGLDWFRFDAGVQVDGKRVSLVGALREIATRFDMVKDLPKLLESKEEDVVPVKFPELDMVLAFPAVRLGQLLRSLLQLFEATEPRGTMLHRLGAARLAGMLPGLEGETAKALRGLGDRLADFKGVTRVKTPRTLQATLRAYQTEGLSWLQFLRSHGLGGILADDMGLGKTVQTLAHVLVEKGAKRLDRPCLIVAPTSVVGNWAAEAGRFAPSLRVLVLQGAERQSAFERIPDHDLVITSYALLPRDGESIQAHEYHYVILDEAQYIKNPASKMAQMACSLRTRHRLCLTGTPMENHLGELWSLFHFLMPGFLGDQESFRRNWRKPIEAGEDSKRREILAKRVAPLMLRRTRGEVLQELPPRTDIVRSVALSRAQAELYEVVRAAMDKRVREAIKAKGLAQSQIVVLDALLKLRQICCDPRLLKLTAARKVKESAKLESFRELVTGLVEEGRRILVFSQFTSMLALLEKCLDKEKIASLKLTGDTPGNERAKLVNAFQAGQAPVFFISLKAGGSGLNLTTADTVIHYDPWWNPAVEEQATGRAHRMGQANPVFVYRLITEGTIEERILDLQKRKAAIATAILEGHSGEPGRGLAIERSDLEMLLAPI